MYHIKEGHSEIGYTTALPRQQNALASSSSLSGYTTGGRYTWETGAQGVQDPYRQRPHMQPGDS